MRYQGIPSIRTGIPLLSGLGGGDTGAKRPRWNLLNGIWIHSGSIKQEMEARMLAHSWELQMPEHGQRWGEWLSSKFWPFLSYSRSSKNNSVSIMMGSWHSITGEAGEAFISTWCFSRSSSESDVLAMSPRLLWGLLVTFLLLWRDTMAKETYERVYWGFIGSEDKSTTIIERNMTAGR